MDDGKTDKAKGRIKEAVGDLADDQDLKKEGKVDKTVGTLKDKVDDAGDAAKKFINNDKD